MAEMTFRTVTSTTRDVPIIEVWYGNTFVATICPSPPGIPGVAFSVVSKYLDPDGLVLDRDEPPALAVTFDLERG